MERGLRPQSLNHLYLVSWKHLLSVELCPLLILTFYKESIFYLHFRDRLLDVLKVETGFNFVGLRPRLLLLLRIKVELFRIFFFLKQLVCVSLILFWVFHRLHIPRQELLLLKWLSWVIFDDDNFTGFVNHALVKVLKFVYLLFLQINRPSFLLYQIRHETHLLILTSLIRAV